MKGQLHNCRFTFEMGGKREMILKLDVSKPPGI
jgi:hypothetical protein